MLKFQTFAFFGSYKRHFQQLSDNKFHDAVQIFVKISTDAYQKRITEVTLENSFKKNRLETYRDEEIFLVQDNKKANIPIKVRIQRDELLAEIVGTKKT
ncbi:MAG: hypothetical protein EZS28_008460 [Streblomastix strix]|uniref:Uncharacterized protein n=1 Tax=Streblomastix strix TaxID=222440 RepID=A0A5J4WM05_9EUKA|nr:MAG: hypothetical protein EZS28_008460 [Streblomastix strix]